MKKEKQDSAFSQLMNYAGSYKMFTYTALVLSAVSAVLALFPFVYLWRIIKAVINAAPDYGNAEGMVHNGWMAVIMALVSMLIYFVALLCSHRNLSCTPASRHSQCNGYTIGNDSYFICI